jgi:broad specificity phosphatase PhoE
METAEIIARRMHLSPIEEDLLLERDNGKANGRIVANFSDEAKLYRSVRRNKIEPFPCLVERVVRFMRIVPFGTSVAVTHQDIIRAAAAHILGLGHDEFSSYGIMPGNGTITVIARSRKGFQLLVVGAPYLASTMLDGG